jgi:hypothetical protein
MGPADVDPRFRGQSAQLGDLGACSVAITVGRVVDAKKGNMQLTAGGRTVDVDQHELDAGPCRDPNCRTLCEDDQRTIHLVGDFFARNSDNAHIVEPRARLATIAAVDQGSVVSLPRARRVWARCSSLPVPAPRTWPSLNGWCTLPLPRPFLGLRLRLES